MIFVCFDCGDEVAGLIQVMNKKVFCRSCFGLRKMVATRIARGTSGNKHIVDFGGKKHGEAIKRGTLRRYGVSNPGQIPGHRRKMRPKQLSTWVARYGTTHPMKNQKVKIKALKKWLPYRGQNGLEKKVMSLCPAVVQFCSGKMFITGMKGRVKSPDARVRGQRKVFEFNSSFSHSEKMTGQTKEEHTAWLKRFYKKANFSCCVIWFEELKNVEKLKRKIQRFCSR